MKRSCRHCAIVVMGAWFILGGIFEAAQAAVPQLLNYQGYLVNASGQALTTPPASPLTMTFSLYTAVSGGSPIYAETRQVAVANGVFSVAIGSVTPLNVSFDVPYFLEIAVGAETLSPRQPLASSAYALRTGCAPGDKVFCYTYPTGTPGVGPCQNGLRTCNAQGTGYGPCVGDVGPNCGSVCANLQSDPANCGSCGLACPTIQNGTATCSAGVCGTVCIAGDTKCAGTCSNLQSDPANCGNCGHSCGPAGTCTSGACSCGAGAILCSGLCFNPSNDPNHCGSCGNVCAAGHACVSGVCN